MTDAERVGWAFYWFSRALGHTTGIIYRVSKFTSGGDVEADPNWLYRSAWRKFSMRPRVKQLAWMFPETQQRAA